MRFQCLDVRCGKEFGWTLKRIVTYPTNDKGENVTEETIRCPYCGSLDFEELSPGHKPNKPQKQEKKTPPPRMPKPAGQADFNSTDLMEHKWKGRKRGEGNYAAGSLEYGWDFADQFKPETIEALKRGPLTIDKYVFKFTGKIVQTKKAES